MPKFHLKSWKELVGWATERTDSELFEDSNIVIQEKFVSNIKLKDAKQLMRFSIYSFGRMINRNFKI